MVKVLTNSQGKVYTSSGKALLAPSGGGGGYQLRRITDDNNNEIGTAYMEFEDSDGNKYDVVCLDAQYRNAATQWCSGSSIVTNLPVFANSVLSWWYTAEKKTATFNTQKIIDYCTANNYTSTACTHCRSKSFTIGGTTYYGQLPNMKEVFDMWANRADIESMDTSANSYSTLNFGTERNIWSSTQNGFYYAWMFYQNGAVYDTSKDNTTYMACPVLEIPK